MPELEQGATKKYTKTILIIKIMTHIHYEQYYTLTLSNHNIHSLSIFILSFIYIEKHLCKLSIYVCANQYKMRAISILKQFVYFRFKKKGQFRLSDFLIHFVFRMAYSSVKNVF